MYCHGTYNPDGAGIESLQLTSIKSKTYTTYDEQGAKMRHATEADREEWWLSLFYNKECANRFFYVRVNG
jgi:hypothetical protein